MHPSYAITFLSHYRKSISKIYARVWENTEYLRSGPNANPALLEFDFNVCDTALVFQAYDAFKNELLKGQHIYTDIERIIWNILYNRPDILGSIDDDFCQYIHRHYEYRFALACADIYPALLPLVLEKQSNLIRTCTIDNFPSI